MARAICLGKFFSYLNGSSFQLKKNHQPFEWLKLSVGEIHQPFEQLELSVQERNSTCKFFGRCYNKTKQDFKTVHQALLNDTCHHVYITQTVVTLLFFLYLRLNDTKFIFYRKTFHSNAPIKLKALWSLCVHGGFRSHALLEFAFWSRVEDN